MSSEEAPTQPLRSLTESARSLLAERGFVVLQGPDPTNRSLTDLKTAVAALSSELGELWPQNAEGDLVKEVKDRRVDYASNKTSRYSDSRLGGNYHTDGAEIARWIRYFTLYCVRPADEGGTTKIVSAQTVHDRIEAEDPVLLRRLYQPLLWDRRGDLGPNGERSFEKPVFRSDGGRLRCDYLRTYIEEGYRVEGLTLPDDAERALDAMDTYLYDPRMAVDVRLEPGEVLICDNTTNLHGRDEFRDAPGRERLLLRCWIA